MNERNEILQDIIDRLLYLSEEKLREYKNYLNVLISEYPIDVRIENGVRVYYVTKNKN